jgi:hypothetical protein
VDGDGEITRSADKTVAWAMAGDRESFAVLVRNHGRLVHAYLARRAGREVADDLSTANGASAVQITATFPNTPKCPSTESGESSELMKACASVVGGGVQERLTINATTGIPITFARGATGQAPAGQITYEVSRVTLSQVAQGQFTAEPVTSTPDA